MFRISAGCKQQELPTYKAYDGVTKVILVLHEVGALFSRKCSILHRVPSVREQSIKGEVSSVGETH